MCLICLDLKKLTFPEAVNNLTEMSETMGPEHAAEVAIKLLTDFWESEKLREKANDNTLYIKRVGQLLELIDTLSMEEQMKKS